MKEKLALNHAGLFDIELFMIEWNEIERNIIEALRGGTLTIEQLAARAGYEVRGHFIRTVSSLSKRGILGNKRPGDYVQTQYMQRPAPQAPSVPAGLPVAKQPTSIPQLPPMGR